MDDISNPYAMGAGNPPPAFAGRTSQINQFSTLLGRLERQKGAQSIIFYGLRGVGKTVLLLELQEFATSKSWIVPEIIEVQATQGDLREQLYSQAHAAILGLNTKKYIAEQAKKLSSILTKFKLGVNAEGNLNISFDPSEGPLFTGNLEHDVPQLFIELGELAKERNTGVVFMIDEMQFLSSEEIEAVAAAMHKMSQKKLPIALVGAGLPQLPQLLMDSKSYSERLFSIPYVGKLSEIEASIAIALPAKEEGVEYTEEALKSLVEVSDGYPSFIQAYAQHAWKASVQSPIDISSVEISIPLAQKYLDEEFFLQRFERATEAERSYMSAMASLGEGPYSTMDVSNVLGHTTSGASMKRASVIKKGLVYSPRVGLIDFTVPHFADFMTRKYPFDDSMKQKKRKSK